MCLDIPREKKMATLFANSGGPDRLIWVSTICQLPLLGCPDENGLKVANWTNFDMTKITEAPLLFLTEFSRRLFRYLQCS